MNFGVWWCVALALEVSADRWSWPDQAASVRIDTKVRFIDQDHDNRGVQADEVPFQEAEQTDGFYNRAPGAGRYPVRVDPPRRDNHLYQMNNFESDGTLDSIQQCKCVSNPDCAQQPHSARACGAGKFLCCYKGPRKHKTTEYFNEISEERPSLLPGREELASPFPPAPGFPERPVLVGPGGLSGHVGPGGLGHVEPAVLVGPGGATGHIGPSQTGGTPAVLVGPEGPTGIIGPQAGAGKRTPEVLVGPGGPTNIIGPARGHRELGQSESAQRGVLVGPGGPTGIIGPRGFAQQRPVLVGPGGPTGIIGPGRMRFFDEYFGQQRNPGVLVGPGGPTGVIGPARGVLVGPGGPMGRIGPQNYFV